MKTCKTKMDYYSSKAHLIYLMIVLMTGSCCCHRKKLFERKTQVNVPAVTCSSRGMRAMFDPTVKSNVNVKDLSGALIPVPQSDDFCGVKVSKEKNKSISVFSRYDSCYAIYEGKNVILPLQVQLKGQDRWIKVNISCPLIKRRSERTHTLPTPFPGDCDTDRSLRLDCGVGSVSAEVCNNLGCCYDVHQGHCYHRLDACSVDGYFVFSVKAKDSHPPIDPRSLVVKHQPPCLPQIMTADIAIFKIGITECGTKMKIDGDMVIYEVEVKELHDTETLHSPFSLQVQCEYEASDAKRAAELQPLYALTNPPPLVALGTIKVHMRIATDASFTSFIPEDQLPLTVPLRETVNVEISIVQPSPDPSLSLFVRDCFAYPASRHSVWTLLYDGCPNSVDNMRSSVPVDHQGKTTSNSQVRRFDVKTFAFLEPDSGSPSAEEMFFYCWVEICTHDAECAQQCTLISPERGRQRREAVMEPQQVLLVSVGPLGQNRTHVEDQRKRFPVIVYLLAAVAGALLFVFFLFCSVIRKCQRTEVHTCDTSESCE